MEIIKPNKTQSLRSLPTVYRVRGSKWMMFLWGLAGFLVIGQPVLEGLEALVTPSQYTMQENSRYLLPAGIFLISCWLNQVILHGTIEVTSEAVLFRYTYLFGKVNEKVEIERYKCLWIQDFIYNSGLDGAGNTYQRVYLKHPWNSFKNIRLYESTTVSGRLGIYQEMFHLPVKTSRWRIIKGFM